MTLECIRRTHELQYRETRNGVKSTARANEPDSKVAVSYACINTMYNRMSYGTVKLQPVIYTDLDQKGKV